MRSIICVVIMFALIGLTACAKKDAAPEAQPESQTETVIATEDFESGEAEGVVEEEVEAVVEEGEEVVEEAPAGGDSDSTP